MPATRFVSSLLLALLVVTSAGAFSKRADYSAEAHAAAVADNRVIVLDFHADWCSTCRKQTSLLDQLAADPDLAEVVLLRVDYDRATELRRRHQVSKQSTLIVLRGEREVARATGLVSRDAIRELIAKAL